MCNTDYETISSHNPKNAAIMITGRLTKDTQLLRWVLCQVIM
jgi:hypothetical protein